jgi:NADH-quinone oxidoreductase subunit F
MHKINSFVELKDMAQELKPRLNLRYNHAKKNIKKREILVCSNTGCISSNSLVIIDKLNEEIEKLGIGDKVSAHATGCFGFCPQGPIVKVFPDDVFYVKVKPEDVSEIIQKHILQDEIIYRLLYEEPSKDHEKVKYQDEMDFYKKQSRIALRNCGILDPSDINDYIANEGYLALGKCLELLTPEEVVYKVKDSGLRGRGGAGFPTGDKWKAAASNTVGPDGRKFVVCNADEGDPGAFMDRSILEGDPHSILEAMAICGYAIGSDTGYIYIRAEYPKSIERLGVAIEQAKESGLLGKNILGSGFDFDIELKLGAGAFVCGEGTALMHSIEGKRGEPRMKTYSSSKSGLWESPTCLNNVETFANIPPIILKGPDWFLSYGTDDSSGTKVFALGGKINNVGLVEVPMGLTLKEVIYEIGGGIPEGRKLKAVQTGGPSGGCIPVEHIDTPIDFKSLKSIGSMMGSGGMLVLDEKDCMVDLAKFFLEFTVEESCGKCAPCRIGTTRLLEILTSITEGNGTLQDIDDLKELSEVIKDASLCGLGKSAPNPVVTTLQYFMDEYIAHVMDKKCPAGKCQNLLSFYITDDCRGCTKCSKVCPASCISGTPGKIHSIDTSKCLKCNTCIDSCKFNAIIKK